MRKEYRKAVRSMLTQGLGERLPAYERVKVDSPLLWSGETVFRWEATDTLHCFVLLVPDARGHQAFTVEVGWSNQGRFPQGGMRPTLVLGPDDPDPLDVDEGIVRLAGLASRKDRWWRLPDPALERPGSIEALQKSLEPVDAETARADAEVPVAHALDMLVGHGAPFLERWVSRRSG